MPYRSLDAKNANAAQYREEHRGEINQKASKYRKKTRKERREYQRSYNASHKKEQREQKHRYYATPVGYFSRTLKSCKDRSAQYNVPFDLTKEFLIGLFEKQARKCALTGREMTMRSLTGGRSPDRASLDRRVPRLGYVKENVRLVCFWVNIAKQEWTDDVLLDWCGAVVQHKEEHTL